MERTLIQKNTSNIMKILIEKAKGISDIHHKGIKGRLRELFITEILNSFLTVQFGIGTGSIINQKGVQSNQTDIIIYDKRILPPFIKEKNLAVYPAESVIATIEVKSVLDKKQLLAAEKSAKMLKNKVFNPEESLFDGFSIFRAQYHVIPLCAVFGYFGNGVRELAKENSGKIWLNNNIRNTFAICLANNYSWLNVGGKGWTICKNDLETNEEIKRFIAVILDNVRTYGELRFKVFTDEKHKDWLSVYMRN